MRVPCYLFVARIILLCYAPFSFRGTLYAHNHNNDSLNIDSLYDLAFHIKYSDINQAIQLTECALESSQRIKDVRNIAHGHYILSSIYETKGEYSKSDSLISIAYDLFSDLSDPRDISMSMIQLGLIASLKGDFSTAMNWYNQALEIKKQINDSDGISILYNNMGIVEELQGNYNIAISYYLKSIPILQKIGNQSTESEVYHNISVLQYNLGEIKDAIDYQHKAISINKRIGNNLNQAYNHVALGQYYLELDSIALATHHSKSAFIFSETLKNITLRQYCLSLFGDVYAKEQKLDSSQYFYTLFIKEFPSHGNPYMKAHVLLKFAQLDSHKDRDTSKAIEFAKKSKEIFSNLETTKELMEVNETLAQLYASSNQKDSAWYYINQAHALQDTLFEILKTEQYFDLERRYQTEQKENALRVLTKEKEIQNIQIQQQRIVTSGIFAGLLCLAGIARVLWKRNIEKQKHNDRLEKKNNKIAALKKEIEHRSRNQMNLALSLLEKHKTSAQSEDTKVIISEYEDRLYTLSTLSQLLSPDDLNGDIELNTYLTILIDNLKFNNESLMQYPLKVNSQITSTALSSKQSLLIALIITEFFTNSIKHAFSSCTAPEINISLNNQDVHELVLDYSDNGKGKVNQLSRGEGLLIIMDMTDQLKGQFIEHDSLIGYRATITFPL